MKLKTLSLASAALFFSQGTLADIGSLLGKDLAIMNAKSGQVLSTNAGELVNGENVYQNNYSGSDEQHWNITQVEEGIYRVTHKLSGKVLEVENGGLEDGGNIRLWDYFPVAHHQWDIDLIGGDTYKFIGSGSSRALDVVGGFEDPGVNVQQWEYLANPQQHWKLVEISSTSTQTLEAESAQTQGVSTGSDSAASNGEFISFAADSRVDFSVSYAANTSYAYSVTYRAPYGEKKQNLYVDNNFVAEVSFPESDSWSTVLLPIDIANDGATHTISLATGWGYMDIDSLNVVATGSGSAILPEASITEIEAESAVITGTPKTINATDASNGQYVKYNDSGNIAFKFYIQQAGTYDVVLRYSGKGVFDKRYMFVEHAGIAKDTAFYPKYSSWSDLSVTFDFVVGENTVNIYAGWGHLAFDKASVVPHVPVPGLENLYYGGELVAIDRIYSTLSQGRCTTSYSTAATTKEELFEGRYHIEAGKYVGYCVPGDKRPRTELFLDLETGDILEIRTENGQIVFDETFLSPLAGGDLAEYNNLLDRMISMSGNLTERYMRPIVDEDDVNAIVDYLNHVKATIFQ